MPLDPQAEAVLAALAQADAKPFEAMSVPEARAAAWGFLGLQGAPEAVAEVKDRYFPGPTADLPVRVFYPEGEGPFPALVYYHGGGWVIGNPEIVDPVCRSMANSTGCAVVAVNYQKAPEHPFPAATDDAWATLQWVVNSADDLGFDATRIGVAGDSAGGNLAAVTALRARDEGAPALAFQVLIYPVTDTKLDTLSYVANAEGYLLQRASMAWFFDHYLTDPAQREDPRVAPARAASFAGLAPALILTAEFDPLHDDGVGYAERLRHAGVDTTLLDHPGLTHGFFWMQGLIDAAKKAHEDVAAWVRDRLHQAAPTPTAKASPE